MVRDYRCACAWLFAVVSCCLGCTANDHASEPAAAQESAPAWKARGERLQKVAQAISDHYDTNNRFPSYVKADEPFFARPHLSWRVWILPQLGHEELFKQFNTEESWDSEHNIKLLEQMPEIYLTEEAAAFAGRKPGTTTIQALSGDGAILDSEKPGQPPSRKGVEDGLSETALLMERHPGRAVPWTKPDDFEFSPPDDITDVTRFGLDGEDFFLIVTVSGDVHRIRKDADIKMLDRLFQRADQRETPWAELEYSEKPDSDTSDANADGSGADGKTDKSDGG